MVVGNGIGNRLQQHCLTRLRLCHDERALTLANGGKEVNNTVRFRVVAIAREVELLAWEEWREIFELLTVADNIWFETIDALYVNKREILLTLLRWADRATHRIARLKAEEFDLRGRHIDIIRRV